MLCAGSGQFTSSPRSLKSLLSVWLAACLSAVVLHVLFDSVVQIYPGRTCSSAATSCISFLQMQALTSDS